MMRRPSILQLTTAAALLNVMYVQIALGQGVIRDSIGAISSGRGGTNIAHNDNLSLILDNPAGLANLPEKERLDFGLDVLTTDLDYTDPDNNANAQFMPFPLPCFGYAKRQGNLTLGFGVLIPAGFGATYDLKHALYGKREYSSLGALVKILPAVAYKIDDSLSVGATFGLAVSYVQLKMPYNFQTGLFAGVPTMMDLKAMGLAPAWSAGMQYKLTEKTTMGLAFLGDTRFHLKGKAKADVSGVGFSPLKSDYDAQADLTWPRSLGAGITHVLNPKHRLSTDVVWTNWREAYDNLGLTCTNGSNPLFNAILGRKVRDTFPLNWDDSVALRLGYEYSLTSCDTIRTGYIYHPSPIPASTAIPLLSGTLEHAFTVGYGHQWKKWRFDLAYQYSWALETAVSRSRIIGCDFDHSTINAQAHWLMLNFAYTW